jgi:hypothetical protein
MVDGRFVRDDDASAATRSGDNDVSTPKVGADEDWTAAATGDTTQSIKDVSTPAVGAGEDWEAASTVDADKSLLVSRR